MASEPRLLPGSLAFSATLGTTSACCLSEAGTWEPRVFNFGLAAKPLAVNFLQALPRESLSL